MCSTTAFRVGDCADWRLVAHLGAGGGPEDGDENLVQLADNLCRRGQEEGHHEEEEVRGHPLDNIPLTLH